MNAEGEKDKRMGQCLFVDIMVSVGTTNKHMEHSENKIMMFNFLEVSVRRTDVINYKQSAGQDE